MKLRLLDSLTDIQEFNGVSISARLQCPCGSTSFEFSHTGKQTKGIIAPFITKKNGQLVLKAICPRCHSSIIVYDSTRDGNHASNKDQTNEFVPFVAPRLPQHNLSVMVKYNYLPDNFKIGGVYSNHFENCFVYLTDDCGKEENALIEE